MNELRLSKRLETVAHYIPEGYTLADIGSDHAYLPCYAFINGIIPSGIAGEVVEGPYQSAKEQVQKTNLEDVISVRKGDGLEVISPGEVDCITIAGMGGTLIQSILDAGKEKLTGVKRLILQPNIGAIKIREWLFQNGWELTQESILEEDGRIYEVLVAEPGNPSAPYAENKEAGLLVGPFLLKEKNNAFIKKWTHELSHWNKILSQIENAPRTDENDQKMKELQEKISTVQEVL